MEVWFLNTFLNHDGELCLYTCVYREQEGGWERSEIFLLCQFQWWWWNKYFNLSKLIFLFHFQIVFLHNDRYIEFHSQSGFYYKTRIPKFGRDFSYHYPSCDLYFVGARYWDLITLCFLLSTSPGNFCS